MDIDSSINSATWQAHGKRVVAHRVATDFTVVIACLLVVGVAAMISGILALALMMVSLGVVVYTTMLRPLASFEASSDDEAKRIANDLNAKRDASFSDYRTEVALHLGGTAPSAPETVSIEAPAPAMPTISDVKLKAQVDQALLGLRTHSFTGPTLTNLTKIIEYIPRLNDVQRGDLDLITTTIVTNTDRITQSLREGSDNTGVLMNNLSKITSQSSPVLIEMREHFENERANSSAFDVNYITSRFPSGSLKL